MAFPREKCTSVFQGGTATSLSLALSLSLLLLHATKNYIYIYISSFLHFRFLRYIRPATRSTVEKATSAVEPILQVHRLFDEARPSCGKLDFSLLSIHRYVPLSYFYPSSSSSDSLPLSFCFLLGRHLLSGFFVRLALLLLVASSGSGEEKLFESFADLSSRETLLNRIARGQERWKDTSRFVVPTDEERILIRIGSNGDI